MPQETDNQPTRLGVKFRDWFENIKDLLKTYWLPFLLLDVALISYVIVLGYQARKPANETQYQVWITQEIANRNAILSIAYPDKLRLESPAETRAISVWLQKMTPTFGPSPTPTSTPTPNFTATSTLTPTVTATPHPWTVSFSPHDAGILFTDREGSPVSPRVVLTPGTESAVPAVLYVQRAPMATMVPSTTLSLAVYDPKATPVLTHTLSSAIRLEDTRKANRRHFQDLLLGPTTPILVLAGSLLAFATKEWRRRSELELQEKKRAIFAEVEQLANLVSQPKLMLERYWELQKRTKSKPDWEDQEVIRRLRKVRKKHLDPESLLRATEDWFGELDDEKAYRCVQLALKFEDEKDNKAQRFKGVLGYLQSEKETLPSEEAEKIAYDLRHLSNESQDDKVKSRVSQLLVDLGKKQDWTRKKIEEYDISYQALRWLDLWPSASPTEPQEVVKWLSESVELAFNPFSPELAELDPRLKDYYTRGNIFKSIGGRRPTLVLGQAGSGKTAAALLLAYDCEDPPLRPREQNIFPVYWSPNLLNTDNDSFLLKVACLTAQAITRYVAHRPDGFLKLSKPRRYGIVRLLSAFVTSPEQLESELQQAGNAWGTPEHLINEVVALYQEVAHEQCLGNLPDLLADALPESFDALYFILDLPTTALLHSKEATVKNIRHFLDFTIPLASRGIYLKLFLPKELQTSLDIPSIYNIVTLTWGLDDLQEMINNRISVASSGKKPSLTALCDPGVPKAPSLSERLAKAADGSPRRLLHLGNELITAHVQRAPQVPNLSVEDITSVLGRE